MISEITPLRLVVLILLSASTLLAADATGTFVVKMTPTPGAPSDQSTIGKMQLIKTYSGDIDGTGEGHMLMVRTATKGSAGYVAIEKITATLAGKSGSFLLQHHGIMNRGNPSLTVIVVPDSADGELQGLSGTMEITNTDGTHHYAFDYDLPLTTS